MLKFLNVLLLLVVSVSIFAGCYTEKSYKTPEQAFVATGIKSKGIIKKVELTDGAIIFYEGLKNDVGVGLDRNYDGNWKWIMGSGMVNKDIEPISFSWANLDQMRGAGKGYHLFWGSVNNEEINKLHIAYNNGWNLNEDAILFDSGLGFRIWYVISTNYYGTVPGVNATGYDKEGKKVYQNY
ncbi:hypothetical protein QFZ77_007402 [Paenibacillus sp. V4I3]|uniref:hypothetical protein n=1 Tax=unclassified Paenibacillus TaxID=185978 RepID=UPI0027822B26|nr:MULTISPECIES: hypothetical protein [unclassified Paenibacillus]MDQ0878743.1 hypothetical protein [Paenibacillus sp. V4I3]MDQ0885404.1 hypothetical protein [Paenibacillus sp. V4I9]